MDKYIGIYNNEIYNKSVKIPAKTEQEAENKFAQYLVDNKMLTNGALNYNDINIIPLFLLETI